MPQFVDDYLEEAEAVTRQAQDCCMKLILLVESYATNINESDEGKSGGERV